MKHKARKQVKRKTIIYLNGKFLTPKEAKVSVLSPGLLYGWGLFETMRSYNNRIIYLDAHLKRIKESCRLLHINLTYPQDKLKKAIKEVVKINNLKDAYVRLTMWKNPDNKTDVSIMVKKYKSLPDKKYNQGFSCMVSSLRQTENSPLARIKSTNYLFYRLAYLEAENKGFDEAIILNHSGYLAEGSCTNLFMVKNKELFTPALECGCLDGITRKVILRLAKKNKSRVHEGHFNLQNLYETDEAFLTNSLIGVMPVKSVENIPIGKIKPKDTLTSFFIKKYNALSKK